jgi:hypothetical protein
MKEKDSKLQEIWLRRTCISIKCYFLASEKKALEE